MLRQPLETVLPSPKKAVFNDPCLNPPPPPPRPTVGPQLQKSQTPRNYLNFETPSTSTHACEKSPDPQSLQSVSLCFVQGEEDESKEATNCQGAQCRALDFGKIPARYLILRLLSELSLSFFLLPSYIASDEGGLKFQFRGFFYQVSSLERAFRRLLENVRNKWSRDLCSAVRFFI